MRVSSVVLTAAAGFLVLSLRPSAQQRFAQHHQGVPIWGAEVVRDSEDGVPMSIFGLPSEDVVLSTDPSLSNERAVNQAWTAVGIN